MKLPYTATCRMDGDDTLIVEDDGRDVYVGSYEDGEFKVSLYLTPADARRLAKAIKKAAKRAEAGQ